MKELVNSIKKHEGFRGYPYKDSLGIPTIGYGTKLPIDKEEAEWILNHRLNKMINDLETRKPFIKNLPEPIREVLYEMAYQLGVGGLLKFKKMLKALEEGDYKKASLEGLNSKWHRQTPNRAEELMKRLENFTSGQTIYNDD